MFSYPFHHRSCFTLGIAIAAVAAAGHGQDNDQPPLTLSRALQQAAAGNLSLAAQQFGERSAEALIEQANTRPNSTLDVTFENFAGTGSVQAVDRLESTVQTNLTFERGGKREKRVTLARREHEATAQELALRRTEILSQTAMAYVDLVAAQARLALTSEMLQYSRETLTLINARVSAGAASSVEATRTRATVAVAQADYNRAESTITAARAALATTWGGTASELSTVAGAIRSPDEIPAESSFRARLATHPRLNLQTAIIAGRRAALALAQAQEKQDITAGGGVRFLREGSDAALVAAVSMPILTRNKNRGNIRAARETLSGAESSVCAIEAELNANFTAAWQELVSAHSAARMLRSDALAPTEEAYVEVRRAYESGELALTEVLDAQRALVAIRRDILAAESDYATALVRLEALTDSTFSATARFLSTP